MTRYLLILLLLAGSVRASVAQERPTRRDSTAAQEESVSFDFQETDIRAVITALAEAGRLNVVFSGLPSRPVTLRTSQPVPRRTVRTLLKSLLDAHGLRMIEEEGVIRVTTAQDAPPQSPPVPTPAQQTAQRQQDSARLYVYRVKHSQAPRLAASIQALFGLGYSGYSGGLNRSLLSDQLRGQRIPLGYPQQQPIPGQPTPGAGRPSQDQAVGELQIVADELANALLVRARPSAWAVIQEAIQVLDIRPLQVLLEALIVEVRSTDLFDLGLAVRTPEQQIPSTGVKVEGQLGAATAGDLVLKVMEIGGVSAEVVISAISSKANVNVVSRPVILAQNNLEARILIGSQRPFIQVVRALPTDAAVRDQVVQYRDVGTSLSILPTINEDGYVSMQLVQEVSNATTETQFGAPVISTREASTNLLVRDGQTAVIGGLIDQQSDRARGGVPVLKNIPLLGWLFGSTRRSKVRTELFLFITPHVIRTDDDATRYREQLQRATDLIRKDPPPRTMIPDTIRRER
jgi:type II secretion system protein D